LSVVHGLSMWESFCEHLSECGRDASLFILAMLVVVVGPIVTLILGEHVVPVLGVLCLILLIRFGLVLKRAHSKFERLGRMPPLSPVDWRVARAKLLKHRRGR